MHRLGERIFDCLAIGCSWGVLRLSVEKSDDGGDVGAGWSVLPMICSDAVVKGLIGRWTTSIDGEPWLVGTDTKLRAWDRTDVAAAGPLLHEFLALLPSLRCVILGRGGPQRGARRRPV